MPNADFGVENIDHSRTMVKSPQTNGIVERLHKTMRNRVLPHFREAFEAVVAAA